jgi:hypothetical protein
MYRITARRRRATAPLGSAPRRGRRTLVGATVVTLTLSATALATAGSAAAADSETVSNATFTWGLNDTASAGAYFGGCNFLSAGTAGDNGSSTQWTETTPSPGYATQAGNVTILKPNADGDYRQPTWDTKCKAPDGTTNLTPSTSSHTEVQFVGGTGTVDPSAGTASITWTGSFTSVFYGGLAYWSAADPTLTVDADGTGTVTASLSGYAASMSDPSKWNPIAPTTVTLANLSDVEVTESGITVTPDYRGVAITPATGDSAQTQTGDDWGSFPQSFVDFQHQTGESSYWYSSGLNDGDKVAAPITVAYSDAPAQTAPVVTTQPVDAAAAVGGTATFTAAASGEPVPTVQWQLQRPGGTEWEDYPGATSPTFDLPIYAAGYDGSQVRAVFTNTAGSVTTDAVTVHVTSAPAVTTQPVETTATVNGTATFTAAASGYPVPTVQWQLQAPGSTKWQDYPGATSTTFDLPIHAAGYDGSQVRAVFTNTIGSATTDAVTLHVSAAEPGAASVLVTTAPATYGASATVTVAVSRGTGAVTLSGAGAPLTATLVNGSATFTLPATLPAGSYTLVAAYPGDDHQTAASGQARLTVAKAGVTIDKLKVNKKAKHGKKGEAKLKLSSVTGVSVGGTVVVTIKHGHQTKKVTVTVTAGKATVKLPKLAKGKWKLKVAYQGTADLGVAKAKTSVKVTK